jgi:hypothetical protein
MCSASRGRSTVDGAARLIDGGPNCARAYDSENRRNSRMHSSKIAIRVSRAYSYYHSSFLPTRHCGSYFRHSFNLPLGPGIRSNELLMHALPDKQCVVVQIRPYEIRRLRLNLEYLIPSLHIRARLIRPPWMPESIQRNCKRSCTAKS